LISRPMAKSWRLLLFDSGCVVVLLMRVGVRSVSVVVHLLLMGSGGSGWMAGAGTNVLLGCGSV